MSDEKLEAQFENEQEWRKFLMAEVQSLRKEVAALRKDMNSFKVHVVGFASFFGTLGGSVIQFLTKKH